MGIDLWLKTHFVLQRPPILKVKVLKFKSIKVTCFAAKKTGFPVQPGEKIRKTEFIEVHIERAVITQLENIVVRDIPHFFSYMRACTAPKNFLLTMFHF